MRGAESSSNQLGLLCSSLLFDGDVVDLAQSDFSNRPS
jgi:hypothetical protein